MFYLARHGQEPADYRIFRGEPSDLRHISGIVRDAFAFQGRGIIQLGLLLMIATPVARVAFSIFGFALEGARMYAGFTLIVIAILLCSLLGSSFSSRANVHKQGRQPRRPCSHSSLWLAHFLWLVNF